MKVHFLQMANVSNLKWLWFFVVIRAQIVKHVHKADELQTVLIILSVQEGSNNQ